MNALLTVRNFAKRFTIHHLGREIEGFSNVNFTLEAGQFLLVAGPNGAVAYIGCDTGGQPCALTLLEGFAQALGQEKQPRLGDAWKAAIQHYYVKERLAHLKPNDDWYPPSIFFQGMKYMVFGDPSLLLPK